MLHLQFDNTKALSTILPFGEEILVLLAFVLYRLVDPKLGWWLRDSASM